MNSDQPYIVGLTHALQAAGHEKTAISRWLANQFGVGVGTAIDKTTGQKTPVPVPEEPAEEEVPPIEEAVEAPAAPPVTPVIGDGIIDTPEEVGAAVVKVLEEAGVAKL